MKEILAFFIGDVALDEYYQTDFFPRLKEKVIVHTLPAQMGGSIANAACVFQSLGNNPYFLTALNSGAITQRLLKGLLESGVNTDYMVFDDTIPDAKCIIVLAENEHTVFIPTLALQKIEIDDKTLQALKSSAFIYSNFCEIAPLKYKNEDVFTVLKILKDSGTKLWCDLDFAELSQKEMELFPFLDVAFVNEMGEHNLEKKLGKTWKEQLFNQGLSLVVVTKAENGCSLYPNHSPEIFVPGISVAVCDVTGAGDPFGSAFLHAYTRSSDLKLCAEFANFVAARAVTGMGARYGVTTKETLKDFICRHGGDPERFDVFFKGASLWNSVP